MLNSIIPLLENGDRLNRLEFERRYQFMPPLYVTSPVIALVEAKNDNLKQGFAQCIAEMIAAAQLN
ncbi:hypothetical protein PN478_16770 [Dolichospermum circinale CS-534/05]|uniref:hypothetical protein n=1 Tax=Dolichospermum circinale TaxID=109265 RepID=UPI00232B587C|nr:hypothetical protein [Dolichospermum circinale]MDB9456323.1 hypothetical protein [Dolichospermum circinale CS-541/06]MDB9461515.1 hypothetical protein [Dolichospermum circinale CS-541/04]MDB9492164.1 hypothetical protein [Dolichospermum circinale CS-534/05]MDB9547462.1 hypothetical protein [Dolichospermum circinale CS-1031]